MSSSSDSDTCEYQGDRCYGASVPATVITYIMAGGGAHWWHHEVHFDTDGEQRAVYINDTNGKRLMRNKVLFFHDEDADMLLLEDADFTDDHWHQLVHYA